MGILRSGYSEVGMDGETGQDHVSTADFWAGFFGRLRAGSSTPHTTPLREIACSARDDIG